jgi:carbonic anhydrase
MATPIQQNLVNKNKAYAESFTGGSLALPPAKKYAVGISPPSLLPSPLSNT